MTTTQPAGRATLEIIARNLKLSISYKLHARERLAERGLIISDVLHALKFGTNRPYPQPGLAISVTGWNARRRTAAADRSGLSSSRQRTDAS